MMSASKQGRLVFSQRRGGMKQTTSDNVFDVVNTILMIVLFLIVAYPMFFVLIASISNPDYITLGRVVFWPRGLNFRGYERVLQETAVWVAYRNTIYYTLLGTSINVFVTVTGGYALSRKDLPGRSVFMAFLVFTMFFSGGMIPTFLLVRSLGMLNTVWAMVLPNAVSVFNVILCRTFFASTIPDEMLEAARMDGCGNLKFFALVAVPLSMALVAVMVLFYAVGHWNSFFNALIYLTDSSMFPLQLVLRQILLAATVAAQDVTGDPTEFLEAQRLAALLRYAVIVVSILPVMVWYPFVQKYFVKGVMIGSVKG
jgi:putative aldouronate transport system permease protein